jgi:chemotaxis protein MotB
MPDDKLVRVVGLAASDLLDKENKLAPINRRISVTVLTRDAESRLFGGARMEGNDAVKAITEQIAKEPQKGDAAALEAATPGASTGRSASVSLASPAKR